MSASQGQDRYRLLSQHFQTCVELSPEEREKYISGPIVEDPVLRDELRTLLRHHFSDLEPPTPSPLPRAETRQDTRIHRRRRGAPILGLIVSGALVLAILLGARAWTLARLEADLRARGLSSLARTVDDRVASLRVWAERQKVLAKHVLENPDLITHIAALGETAAATNGNDKALLSSPSYKPVFDAMMKAPPEIAERGFVVITPSGVDLCAEDEDIVGRVVTTSGAAYLRRAVMGEWIVSRPYPNRQFAQGVKPDYDNPMMFVAGPVYDKGGKLLAMAVFRFSPRKEFFKLCSEGEPKVLAFDDKEQLLTDCGETEQLRKHGLIPSDGLGMLRLRLLDPGGDLSAGYRPEAAPESWAPTLMCRQAVASGRGSAPEYRDALGRAVAGAWVWLPEWEMGIGAEEQLGQLLAPLRPIRTMSGLILGIPVLVTALLLLRNESFRSVFQRGKSSTFGSYVLERPIGKGGMAEVFLARHEILKRPAAVKILSNPNPDAASVARFEREARLACRLGHPNTIQIFDYGETPEGKLYYAMEYVKGVNLAQLIAMATPLPVARVLFLLRQVAGALEEAQAMGLVHRDLKPSNVMVCSKGGLGDLVKVLDFGIACSSSPSGEDYTQSLELVGTPAYIAPERIRNPQGLDPRSDIYSFGAVAFNLLTGRNVFEGPGPTEVIYQVMSATRPSPSQLRGELLPGPLERLVLDCLAVDPEARPESFQAVLEALDSVGTEDRWGQQEAREWWTANRDRLAAFSLP